MTILQLLFGLVLLLGGGEFLVRGAVAVARRLGVSPLMIGLTLVGFGTSAPEMVASVKAALVGAPGIALGNVVGSNIANILLIIGLAAVILPLATTRRAFRRDGTMLLGSTALLVVAGLSGTISLGWGLLFLALLLGYLVYTYLTERGHPEDPSAHMHAAEAEAVAPPPATSLAAGLGMAVGGIVGVVVGAHFLVEAAIVLARAFGLSEAVIGLTLIAVGTSLPELVTSVMAALRGQSDVAFGNVVGSNIFNTFGIMGVTAVVVPVPVPGQILAFDLWVMAAVSVLLVVFAATGWRVNRWEGAVFLALYGGYLTAQLSPAARGVLGLA